MVRVLTASMMVLCAIVAFEIEAKSKAEKLEAGFIFGYYDNFDIDGQQGASVDFDDDYGFGISFSYNYTEQFAVEFDWMYSATAYQATLVGEAGEVVDTISHEADMTHSQLYLTYYLSPESFSFYVQAGAGGTYIDSNVASSPPIDACWWDPWWGYICGDFQDTYSDTRFSYSATLGARYSLTNDLILRIGYSQLWIDMPSASSTDVGIIKFQVGRSF